MKETNKKNNVNVLLGRGPVIAKSPGNLYFRKLVDRYGLEYLTSAINDKRLVARKMVQNIKNRGGKFLHYDEDKKKWLPVKDERAEEKAMQLLRDHASKAVQQQGVPLPPSVPTPSSRPSATGKSNKSETTIPSKRKVTTVNTDNHGSGGANSNGNKREATILAIMMQYHRNEKYDVMFKDIAAKIGCHERNNSWREVWTSVKNQGYLKESTTGGKGFQLTQKGISRAASVTAKEQRRAKKSSKQSKSAKIFSILGEKHGSYASSTLSKKKKKMLLTTKHHKKSKGKPSVVTVSAIPKHRLIGNVLNTMTTMKGEKWRRQPQQQERLRVATPSPPSNNYFRAVYQPRPVEVKPTKEDTADHDLDEIRQLLNSSVDGSSKRTIVKGMQKLRGQNFTSQLGAATTWTTEQHSAPTPITKNLVPQAGSYHHNHDGLDDISRSIAGGGVTKSDKGIDVAHATTWKRYTCPSSQITSSSTTIWWDNYRALKKFHATFGHCVIPLDWDARGHRISREKVNDLIEWTARQRQINREIAHGYREATSEEVQQLKLLKQINFPMTLDSIPRPSNNSRNNPTKRERLDETPNVDTLSGYEPYFGVKEDEILVI